MRYVARPPVAPLADFVEYVWESRGAPAHAKERVVPTGTLELLVNLAEDGVRIYDADGRAHTLSGAVVSGAYRRPFTFDTRESAFSVGAHFRPGRASELLGVPAGALSDRHVDLDALWGRRANELRERLCAAATTEQRFAILEAELLSRLDGRRRAHPVVGYAIGALRDPRARVGDIVEHAGVSPRRLIELFTASVGITPKRFGRIARLHRAAALARSASLDWARIAHDCGYADQSHLIRDFRELAGVTPRDLIRASVHVAEHHQLAVLDA
ncbi:MAG TPA: AraC family transcriptional regulator [Sandaracinaceae bacterium]